MMSRDQILEAARALERLMRRGGKLGCQACNTSQ